MQVLKRYRWLLIGVGAATLIATFLAFRPDTIFRDDAVDESLSDAFQTPPSTVPDTLPPTTVSTGGFVGIDHSAMGTATVYEQDGTFVLRFEDGTDIQNGPDLFVWVLPADDYTGGAPTEYLDLGKLKGNVGGQNYELPPEYDPQVHRVVLVWCKRFSVPFAAAPLT